MAHLKSDTEWTSPYVFISVRLTRLFCCSCFVIYFIYLPQSYLTGLLAVID